MFSIMKQRGKTHYNIVEFICEYLTDIDTLPTNDYVGSTAYVIEDGAFFILNHDKKWIKKKSSAENDLEKKIKEIEELELTISHLNTTNSNLINENIMLKEEIESLRLQNSTF